MENKIWWQVVLRSRKPHDKDDLVGQQWGCPERTILDDKVVGALSGGPVNSGYGLNAWVMDALPGWAAGYEGPHESDGLFWRTTLRARNPGHVPVVLDCVMAKYALPDQSDPPPPHDPETTDSFGSVMGSFCVPRHGSYVNALFMDWSVRPVGLKELWTLKWHRQYNPCGKWTKTGGVQSEDWPPWMRGFRDY
ncbi:MAG: hypothetical protein JSW27_13395 [Phycisphaerales bacterium]|nr:MAG: hypothetical protein JSW27_13395 [Phycisphaerales bacterium]